MGTVPIGKARLSNELDQIRKGVSKKKSLQKERSVIKYKHKDKKMEENMIEEQLPSNTFSSEETGGEEKSQESKPETTPKEEFPFKEGDPVKIRSDSGELEEGWFCMGPAYKQVEGEKYTVDKSIAKVVNIPPEKIGESGSEEFEMREVPVNDLLEWNKEGLEKETEVRGEKIGEGEKIELMPETKTEGEVEDKREKLRKELNEKKSREIKDQARGLGIKLSEKRDGRRRIENKGELIEEIVEATVKSEEGIEARPEVGEKLEEKGYAEMHKDYEKRGIIKCVDPEKNQWVFTENASALDRELLISKYTQTLKERGEKENKDEIEKWEKRLTGNEKTIKEIIDDWVKSRQESGEKTIKVDFGFSEEELDQRPAKLIEVRKIFEDQLKKIDEKLQPGEPNILWQIMPFIEAQLKDTNPEAPPEPGEIPEEAPPGPEAPPGSETREPEITEKELNKLRNNYLEILHQRNRKFFTWLKTKLLRSYQEGMYSEESLNKAREDYEKGLTRYREQELKKYKDGIKVDGYTIVDADGNILGTISDERSLKDIMAEQMARKETELMLQEIRKQSEEEARIVSGDLGYKFGKFIKRHPGWRAAIGFGLTGLAFTSLATGALPLAGAALGLRAAWAGMSTTVGTEGLLQFAGEKVSRYRGMMKKLSEEEMKNMSKEELLLRLCAFQENQAKKGETIEHLSPKEIQKYSEIAQAYMMKRAEEIKKKIEDYEQQQVGHELSLEAIKACLTEDYLREEISEETKAHERMISRRKKFGYAKWVTAITAGVAAGVLAYVKFGAVTRKGEGAGTREAIIGTETKKPPSVDDRLFYGSVRPGKIGSSTDIIDQQLTQYAQATGKPITLSRGQYSYLRDLVDRQWPHPLDNKLHDGYMQSATGRQLKALLDHVLSQGPALNRYYGWNIPFNRWYFAGDPNWLKIL